MNYITRLFFIAMALFLTGCSSKEKWTAPEEQTIKIMYKGDKPEGMDRVLEEFYKRTERSLNIRLVFDYVSDTEYKEKSSLEVTSESDYDLVFDANWFHLSQLAADGRYADLSGFFDNDEYPGLKKAFPQSIMENNKYYGKMCYIPLYRTMGNGIGVIYYRQDWAQEWGLGTIENMEQMVRYWEMAKEKGLLPLSVTGKRGYFQVGTIGWDYPEAAKAGIQRFQIANINYWVYIKDNKVNAVAAEGSGDKAFKEFPPPFNRDFGVSRYETFAEWTKKGYIGKSSAITTDAKLDFYSGDAASIIGNLDEYIATIKFMDSYKTNALLGTFIYDDAIRNKEKHCWPTTYRANNGLCVPSSSKNVLATMRFLNWLFLNNENHDLFAYGIEGEDYNKIGEDQYVLMSDYLLSGPSLTWNPNYDRIESRYPENLFSYRKYEMEEDTYFPQPVCGYNFDFSKTDISTTIITVEAIMDEAYIALQHGLPTAQNVTYDSVTQMYKAYIDLAYRHGAKEIEDALVQQINEYLTTSKD